MGTLTNNCYGHLMFTISALVEINKCSSKRCYHSLDAPTSHTCALARTGYWRTFHIASLMTGKECLTVLICISLIPTEIELLCQCLLGRVSFSSGNWAMPVLTRHSWESHREHGILEELFFCEIILINYLEIHIFSQWSSMWCVCSQGYPKLFIVAWESISKLLFMFIFI